MEVMDALRTESGFRVTLNTGDVVECKKLLLATGITDELPEVDGVQEFYGSSIFHCPYCDGWEFSDQPIAIYGSDQRAFGLAMKMLDWSTRLTICSNGVAQLDQDQKRQLADRSISLIETPIQKFEGADGLLERITFDDGNSINCKAVFFALGHKQKSHLPEKLGCQFNDKGCVVTSEYESTCVPNLYVAGDASEQLQLAIIAAAEGANAAFAINTALQSESYP
jgi:thioredoxin reductase